MRSRVTSKMTKHERGVSGLLTGQLREQFAESERLEAEIRRNLGGLGYEL